MKIEEGVWQPWSQRSEITPRFSVDAHGLRSNGSALKIEGGGDPAAWGAWERRIEGVRGGGAYRFTAHYRTQGVARPLRSVSARLEWQDESERMVAPPDFLSDSRRDGEWTKVEQVSIAPENATRLLIRLALGWSENGTVWWDDVEFKESEPPRSRIARVATVHHRPQGMASPEESVESFCRMIERAGAHHPDLVLLPEGISIVGNRSSYIEAAEPLPGPTTRRLGALAKQFRCYLAAGMYEREGSRVYNTAVLIGRDGELAGSYRKTHLPREEVEGGLTPGDDYPVFSVDFGIVGLMVCWDVQFPEPARALALRGAEVLLLPIWGGSDLLARARAIENHCHLVASSYDMRSFVVDPAGQILAEATQEEPVVVADLSLDRKIMQPWIGDMRARTWKERRGDLPVEPQTEGS